MSEVEKTKGRRNAMMKVSEEIEAEIEAEIEEEIEEIEVVRRVRLKIIEEAVTEIVKMMNQQSINDIIG